MYAALSLMCAEQASPGLLSLYEESLVLMHHDAYGVLDVYYLFVVFGDLDCYLLLFHSGWK